MTRTLFAAFAAFAFVLAPVTHAQTPGEPPVGSAGPEVPAGLVSCFDHYAFGSVPASLSGSTRTVAAGTDMTLSGTIENRNDYPVAGIKIYAKVFDAGNGEKSVQGPDVLDDFLVIDTAAFGENYVREGFSLSAGESRAFTLSYPLPSALPDGEYQVALYTIASDRFNMAGLSFTDDVVGGLYPFTVVAGGDGSARFDKSSFTVAGKPHRFAAFPTQVMPSEKVILVEGVIANPTNRTITGSLTWTLYPWDTRNSGALKTETKMVAIPPNGTLPVSYEITDSVHPVYQVVGRLDTVRGSSVASLRITRLGLDEPRLNFAGIDSTDSGNVLFACLHNTGSSPLMEGASAKVEVLTRGVFTRTLAKKEYEGPVSGNLAALATPVSLMLAEPTIIVRTTLLRGGAELDTVSTEYQCKDFKGCGPVSLEQFGLIVLILLGIGVPAILALRRKRASSL